MFGECEHCGKKIAFQINLEEGHGTVGLCQCTEAFAAHVQEHRLKFQRKIAAQRVFRDKRPTITPRKVSRHRS